MSYGTLQIEKMTTESGYSLGAGNASSFKNRIINGAMMVNQRGGPISASGLTNTYGLDRFAMRTTNGSAVVSMQQSTTAPTGFYNSLLCTVTTADASLAASDLTALHQKIEGVNVPDIGWGTANAQTVTLSFWVNSSVTGTYGVGIENEASNRAYPSTFTVNSANTWEYKTVSIPGDTTGTWNLGTTSTALYVFFSLSAGSDFTSGTTNAWNAADRRGASGQVNWCATNGNTFYITGVQLEVGTVATSFDFRNYGTELFLCRRYYELGPTANYVWLQSTTAGKIVAQYQVAKRSSSSISTVSGGTYLQQNIGDTFPSGNNANIGTLTFTIASNISNVSGFGADFTITVPATVGTGFTIFWNNASVPLWAASSEL